MSRRLANPERYLMSRVLDVEDGSYREEIPT